MPISDALRRLLHVRTLEEEQRKVALESALADVHRLESALQAAREHQRSGRERIVESSQSADPADRIAGLVECESAQRSAQLLEPRLSEAVLRTGKSRQDYLAKRVERRQVQTVIEEAQEAHNAEEARRTQQSADEWFSARKHAGDGLRQSSEKPEMKNRKEPGSIPEEELRSNL